VSSSLSRAWEGRPDREETWAYGGPAPPQLYGRSFDSTEGMQDGTNWTSSAFPAASAAPLPKPILPAAST
jgi:hypothetical protein